MAGVGKLLKQAQKMQKKVEAMQASLSETELEVSSGGGAVTVKIAGDGVFREIKLDPELLQEEAALVESTILEAVKEAAAKAKQYNDDEMAKATEGMNLPGFM